MPSPDSRAETAGETIPHDLVEAAVYASAQESFEHGIVVLAMGEPCWLEEREGRHRLLVEPQTFGAAREQLERFDRESLTWPPQPSLERTMPRPMEFVTPMLWALIVLAGYHAQYAWPSLTSLGALDPRALFDRGEWWRAGTALFLHGDVGHVVSNVTSGIFVFSAVLSTIGRRRGWLLLALGALAGNIAVAAMNYPGPYRSIGASTAVFAGLGLLTGRAIRAARLGTAPQRWRAVFVPLVAGLTILGLYGAGGLRIDVGAHVAGFAAGLVLGFVATISRTQKETTDSARSP